MQLLKRDPRRAYYSNALHLPKSHFSRDQLASTLTYDRGLGKEPYMAWREDRHHYVVPRNYLSPSVFTSMPFPIIDARIGSFPKVSFESKVVLDLKSDGGVYQTEGVAALLASNHGVLSLRCGAGKSVCAIHAISQLRTPGLIIVNDLGLAGQWIREIIKFTDLKREDVGFIGDGKFVWQKALTVAVVDTLAGRVRAGTLPPELVAHFGVVVADEAHTTAGPAFYHLALTPFHGRRWGLSATPRRDDGFDSLLRYTLGPVVYSYLIPELTPLIFFRRLPTRIDMRDKQVVAAVTDVTGEVHLKKIFSYLATREDRTKVIVQEAKAALAQGRHILLLSQSRAMVDRLGQAFPGASVINGSVEMETRNDLIESGNPVIAISDLGRQALNKPVLDTLMVCESYRKEAVLQQLLGRIQRPEPNKQPPLAVFYDDVHIPKMHKICLKVRSLFNRWPESKGGRLRWHVTGTE